MKFNHRGAQKKSRQGNLTHQSTPPAKLTKSDRVPIAAKCVVPKQVDVLPSHG